MELGIYTFAELTPDPATGRTVSPGERLRDLLEEIELADQVGLDVFGVGEHHRPDFAVSAPAVVLAAAAERTERIRLTSAVSVLGSDDPIRVFQDFATVDLLSGGRAEIMAGRGSFIESFPLFGHDLRDYDALFAEKLDLLLAVRETERVTWSGRHRAPLEDRGVYPRPHQHPLPVWVAVGGTPESAVRAGALLTLLPRFEPAKALEILQRDAVTIFEGVPTMYGAMLHDPAREGADLSCLRMCVSGGASLPVELMRAFEEAFDCIILEGYGLSETSPVASFNHPDRPRKPGSIGTPIAGVEMKLVDEDGNGPDVQSYYAQALTDAGIEFNTWDLAANPDLPQAFLTAYTNVVWFTGNAYPAPLAPYESELTAFLDGGGRLMMSGQDILDQTAGQTAFVQNYLHIDWDGTETQNDIGTDAVHGVTGNAVTDGIGDVTIDHSVLSAEYEDEITPNGTATAAFTDDGGQTNALTYSDGYKVFFLAFPFEAYGSAVDKATLMANTFAFFGP